VVWNGKDDNGVGVGSGVYFYRMQTVNYTETRKMLLIKWNIATFGWLFLYSETTN